MPQQLDVSPGDERRARRKAATAGFFGSVLEYYDFSLYATAAATVFPTVFFPGSSTLLSALQSVATFSIAFLVRPVAGAFLGSIGDRFGRRRVLVFTLLTMGIATACVGLIPGYSTIGWLAPLLLVLSRITQGIGASGEFGGATLVAVEFAPDRRRGLLGSLPAAGASFGGMLGTLAMLAMSALLTSAQFLNWGWRVPFLLSLVLVAYGSWLRLRLPETPSFRTLEHKARTPLRDIVRRTPGSVLAIIAIVTAQTGFGYFYLVFVVSYAGSHIGLSRDDTFLGLVIAQVSCGLLIPVFGWLSDILGRRVVITIGLVASGALAFPGFGLIQPGWPAGLWLAMFLGNGVAASAIVAPAGPLVTELFPAQYRYSGMGLAREFGNMLGAACIPLLAVRLSYSNNPATAVGLMLVVLAALGLGGVALASVRRRTEELLPAGDTAQKESSI
ncbi:MHS family MFS transporter [Amycolatopsis sp. K13G38]|uniref:MHS family MFS transporter n=1 Tax=Amycolatopsis acididurans TaxID=2724524 RepID=A0ABX1JDK2_9PSEU|nr:MFS transporter [Amycolatopsis acididurans]NKQ56735.1 MHS family MFS transporter [Amycolatopsis acididurans]